MIHRRAFTLIETVVYLAIFSVVTIFVLMAMGNLVGVFGRARNERKIEVAGGLLMERIVREIRTARSVLSGTTDTVLELESFPGSDPTPPPPPAAPVYETHRIQLAPPPAPTQVILTSASTFALTPTDVRVTKLKFRRDDGASSILSQGIFVEFNIEAGRAPYVASTTFRSFAILRGSY